MHTPFLHAKQLVMILSMLSLTTGCSTIFHITRKPVSIYSERVWRITESNTTKAFNAAENDYYGIGPFLMGTVTGITLPAATAGPAYAITSVSSDGTTRGIAGGAVGIGSFAFWLWGGSELSKMMPRPSPDRYTADLSSFNRRQFEQIYNRRLENIRSSRFRFGAFIGATIPIVVLFVALANFGTPGV